MQQLNETDAAEEITDKVISSEDVKAAVDRLSTRKKTYESYLDELSKNGETQKSLTDPDARLMRDAKGFDVSYNVQISVDSKYKLIAEFGISNDGNDMKQLHGMAAATAEILEVPTITASADTGYNNPSEIAKCIGAGITTQVSGSEGTMCIPCLEHEAETVKSHENGKAVFIKERNIVICPMGNILFPRHYKNSGRAAVYYNYTACNNCTQKCTKVKYRQFAVRMKKFEFTKEYNIEGLYIKQIHIKPDLEITARRKELAEHPFGTLKRSMVAGYLLTKGLNKVTGEFSLAFLVHNLKRVINIIGVKALLEAIN
jgi:hypothetical protein